MILRNLCPTFDDTTAPGAQWHMHTSESVSIQRTRLGADRSRRGDRIKEHGKSHDEFRLYTMSISEKLFLDESIILTRQYLEQFCLYFEQQMVKASL